MNKYRFLFLFTFAAFAVVSCENSDLKKARAIALQEKMKVETTLGAEIIYSDSAKVKAKMKAPVLLHFQTENPYYEMPKGIDVTFYDEQLQPTSTVTSDYAIRREKEKLVELRKNVVATNTKGETFKSEELIWDEKTKMYHSDKLVTITQGGSQLFGYSFWAKEDFSDYGIADASGTVEFQGDLTGPAVADSSAQSSMGPAFQGQ